MTLYMYIDCHFLLRYMREEGININSKTFYTINIKVLSITYILFIDYVWIVFFFDALMYEYNENNLQSTKQSLFYGLLEVEFSSQVLEM